LQTSPKILRFSPFLPEKRWSQSFVELQTSPKLPGKRWFFSGNYAPLEVGEMFSISSRKWLGVVFTG
tara:strand:- start:582 stop:782 length:201 start_codon:yes stop_codon:yes gene_type:complete